MRYAIQMCEIRGSEEPRIFDSRPEKAESLDEVKILAKARLDTAADPDSGEILTDEGWTDAAKVFVRVVELDGDGSATQKIVFKYGPMDKR